MTLAELKELTSVELEYIIAHIYKLVKEKVTADTKVRDICKQEFPIDLFMAYGDYKYGVFS